MDSFSQIDLQFLLSSIRVATLTLSTSGLYFITALARSSFTQKIVQLENEMRLLSSLRVVFRMSVAFFWF